MFKAGAVLAALAVSAALAQGTAIALTKPDVSRSSRSRTATTIFRIPSVADGLEIDASGGDVDIFRWDGWMNTMLARMALAGMGFVLVLAGASCADRGQATGHTSIRQSAATTFRCPVTLPNAQAPPGERGSPSDFGNGRLWTLLPADGKLVVTTTLPLSPGTVLGELHRDGSTATKFPWWGARSAGRELQISGRTLDRQAEPLRASVKPGFAGGPHFWATKITFPSQGCWQVTGSAGTQSLTFVLQVMKADGAPDPRQPRSAPRPPAPRVRTVGVTRLATLVSYCWTEARRGVCADGAPGHAAQILSWRTGSPLRLDLRLAGHDVHFDAERIAAHGAKTDVVHLRARRLGKAGRVWTLCLPLKAKRATDLLISAVFAHGDLLADLGLQQVQAPPPHTDSRPNRSCPNATRP